MHFKKISDSLAHLLKTKNDFFQFDKTFQIFLRILQNFLREFLAL